MYIVFADCYHVTVWHAPEHHVTECKSKSFSFLASVQTLFQKSAQPIGAADRRTALAGALSFVFSLPVEVKVK